MDLYISQSYDNQYPVFEGLIVLLFIFGLNISKLISKQEINRDIDMEIQMVSGERGDKIANHCREIRDQCLENCLYYEIFPYPNDRGRRVYIGLEKNDHATADLIKETFLDQLNKIDIIHKDFPETNPFEYRE